MGIQASIDSVAFTAPRADSMQQLAQAHLPPQKSKDVLVSMLQEEARALDSTNKTKHSVSQINSSANLCFGIAAACAASTAVMLFVEDPKRAAAMLAAGAAFAFAGAMLKNIHKIREENKPARTSGRSHH